MKIFGKLQSFSLQRTEKDKIYQCQLRIVNQEGNIEKYLIGTTDTQTLSKLILSDKVGLKKLG